MLVGKKTDQEEKYTTHCILLLGSWSVCVGVIILVLCFILVYTITCYLPTAYPNHYTLTRKTVNIVDVLQSKLNICTFHIQNTQLNIIIIKKKEAIQCGQHGNTRCTVACRCLGELEERLAPLVPRRNTTPAGGECTVGSRKSETNLYRYMGEFADVTHIPA